MTLSPNNLLPSLHFKNLVRPDQGHFLKSVFESRSLFSAGKPRVMSKCTPQTRGSFPLYLTNVPNSKKILTKDGNSEVSISSDIFRKKDLSSPSPPNVFRILEIAVLQETFEGLVKSLFTNCIQKAAVLLCICMRPGPHSSLGKNKTDCGTQCKLSQKTEQGKIAFCSVSLVGVHTG